MGDWSSYALTDFLMFTPTTYFRQYELVNALLWPWQILLLLEAIAAMWARWRLHGTAVDWALLLLAPAWAVSGWWFVHQHYAPINTAAGPIAWAFALQALLLVVAAFRSRQRTPCRAGCCLPGGLLFAYGLVLHPLLGLLMGRSGSSIEWFGVAPDPTALVTLGLVLTLPSRAALWLAWVPFAWCVFSGLTYLAMSLEYGLLTPVVAVVAIVARALCGGLKKDAPA